MSLPLGPPEPLLTTHLLDGFDCGEPVVDDWLKRRALANQLSGASRTFVVADDGGRVVGDGVNQHGRSNDNHLGRLTRMIVVG